MKMLFQDLTFELIMLDNPNLWHFEAQTFIFHNLYSPVLFAAGCIYIRGGHTILFSFFQRPSVLKVASIGIEQKNKLFFLVRKKILSENGRDFFNI